MVTVICDNAHHHLITQFAQDPHARAMLAFNGQQYLRKTKRHSLLEYLGRAIAGQQLSTRAAATIWGRVKALQASHHCTFAHFLNTVDFDSLRQCGLSTAKTKTLLGLAVANKEGLLNARKLKTLNNEELVAHLCQFWGVGQWTAEMCAIGYFKMTDIWSEGDVGLNNAITALYAGDHQARSLAIARAQPFRSYWSLHLWAALDNGYFSSLNQ